MPSKYTPTHAYAFIIVRKPYPNTIPPPADTLLPISFTMLMNVYRVSQKLKRKTTPPTQIYANPQGQMLEESREAMNAHTYINVSP